MAPSTAEWCRAPGLVPHHWVRRVPSIMRLALARGQDFVVIATLSATWGIAAGLRVQDQDVLSAGVREVNLLLNSARHFGGLGDIWNELNAWAM